MPTLFAEVRCLKCHHRMSPDPYRQSCERCGSPWLDAVYDTAALPANWGALLKERVYSLWRYEELYPFPAGFHPLTLGEGWTPLLRAEGLEQEMYHEGIWIKDERRHSTGSFKDRQAATAVSALRAQGIDEVVLSSTGNAAAAYAAYCARAGIKLWLFVISSVPAEKMRELALYTAEVVKVSGTYDEAKAIAADFAARRSIALDRGAKSIPCKESMKTIAFEIAEQWPRRPDGRWGAPDWYLQAVSGGIGPLGVLKGFEELASAGIIDRVPKIGVIQTKGCSPMVQAWNQDLDEAVPISHPDSLITVLSTGNPGEAYRMLKHGLDTYGGTMVAVGDGEAFRAMRRVARLEGLSMEPAAAVAFAGLEKLLERGDIRDGETVVVNCSGHTFSAEKYTLEDRYMLNLSLHSPEAVRPTEGLATALEELDERITTLVIIDDNPYDSRLIRRFMQHYRHYRVFEANNAKDGLDLVRQRQPDVVLLDLMMPEMDGFGVLDVLKDDPRTARIPIVIVSAKSLTTEERERLDAYAESVWQKGSFSARDLVTHVVDLVEDHQQFEDLRMTGGVQAGDSLSAPALESEGAPAEFGHRCRRRILLVDSYEPEARFLRRLLETRPGYQVFEARSGAEALTVVGEVAPDAIVLDLALPDMRGEKLVMLLAEHHNTCRAPVIGLTSQDDFAGSAADNARRARYGANVASIWSKSALDRSSFLAHVEALLAE